MATIANLAVRLTTNIAKFGKGFKRAGTILERFGKRINALTKRLAKYGAVMAAAVAGGLALMTRRAMKAGDELAKTSDKLGVATAQLQQFHLAAELSGVKVRTFDMALQRMTRRISEAAAGTGEAKAALKELTKFGLPSAGQLQRMGPGAAFLEIADAMKRVESQSNRVRLAFKLFDSEGVAVVNMLQKGRAGIEAATEGFESLGLVITRKLVAKIEMANDALTTMRAKFKAVGMIIAAEIAPFFERAVTWMDKFTASFGRTDSAVRKFINGMAVIVGAVGDAVELFIRAFKQLKAIILRVVADILIAFASLLLRLSDLAKSFKKHDLAEHFGRMVIEVNADTMKVLAMQEAAQKAFQESLLAPDFSVRLKRWLKNVWFLFDKRAQKVADEAEKRRGEGAGLLDLVADKIGRFAGARLPGLGPRAVEGIGAQRIGAFAVAPVHNKILNENEKQVALLRRIDRKMDEGRGIFT